MDRGTDGLIEAKKVQGMCGFQETHVESSILNIEN